MRVCMCGARVGGSITSLSPRTFFDLHIRCQSAQEPCSIYLKAIPVEMYVQCEGTLILIQNMSTEYTSNLAHYHLIPAVCVVPFRGAMASHIQKVVSVLQKTAAFFVLFHLQTTYINSIYTTTYTQTYIYTYMYTCIYTYVYVHVHMHSCTDVCIHTCVYIYTCIHIYISTFTYIYVYLYINRYIHKCTCIYVNISVCMYM